MRRAIFFIFGCLILFTVSAKADPKANISITVIHAKKGAPFLHPALESIWETLKKTFGERYTSYDQISLTESELSVDEEMEVEMPDKEKFKVQYRGITENKGLLRIAITYGDFQSKVRIVSGGLFFQAGKKYKDGTLIIGIRATLIKE